MRRTVGLALGTLCLAAATCGEVSATSRGGTAEERAFEAAIEQNLKTYLRMNPQIDAKAITIEADNNTVTLRGEVPDWRTHDQVIEAARQTNGVSKVVDALTVREPRLSGPAVSPRAPGVPPPQPLPGAQR